MNENQNDVPEVPTAPPVPVTVFEEHEHHVYDADAPADAEPDFEADEVDEVEEFVNDVDDSELDKSLLEANDSEPVDATRTNVDQDAKAIDAAPKPAPTEPQKEDKS